MNDYVKDGLVFLGGATVAVGVCATVAITTMVRDEDIRNATVAAVSNKITRWLCGDNYYRPLRSRREHVTYRDYYNSKKQSRTPYVFIDVLFDSYDDAQKTLEAMFELVDDYGYLTVADFYGITGKSSIYADNNYGWRTLKNAEVIKDGEWYKISSLKENVVHLNLR